MSHIVLILKFKQDKIVCILYIFSLTPSGQAVTKHYIMKKPWRTKKVQPVSGEISRQMIGRTCQPSFFSYLETVHLKVQPVVEAK